MSLGISWRLEGGDKGKAFHTRRKTRTTTHTHVHTAMPASGGVSCLLAQGGCLDACVLACLDSAAPLGAGIAREESK